MDWTPYFTGAIAGFLLAYLLLYLLHKSRAVNRKEHEAMRSRLNETVTHLTLADERLKSHLEMTASIQQKHDLKENEIANLLSRTAGLEVSLKNAMERLGEHSELLGKERDVNRSQQSELNLHQRQVAELKILNDTLREKLELQKAEVMELQKPPTCNLKK